MKSLYPLTAILNNRNRQLKPTFKNYLKPVRL